MMNSEPDPADVRIVSVSSNVAELDDSPKTSLLVTAQLALREGLGVDSGALLATSGQLMSGVLTIAPFVATGPGGQFVATATFAEVAAAGSGGGAIGLSVGRTLTARFFDKSGRSVDKDVTVSLRCQNTTERVCSTGCVTNDNANNCGGCDNVCPLMCDSGRCVDNVSSTAPYLSCGNVCAAVVKNDKMLECRNDCAIDTNGVNIFATGTNGGSATYGPDYQHLPLVCGQVPPQTDYFPTYGTENFQQMGCCCEYPF
jgi:hypothetical protein